jgi:hypothetical protein
MISRQGEFLDCAWSGRLIDCEFEGSSSRVPGAIRPRNDFSGNDFTDADLVRVAFLEGIDLDAQRLPQGDDYLVIDDPVARATAAERVVLSWPASPGRDRALRWLDGFRWSPMAKQAKVLTRRSEVMVKFPDIRDAVLELMTESGFN